MDKDRIVAGLDVHKNSGFFLILYTNAKSYCCSPTCFLKRNDLENERKSLIL